MKTNLKLKYLLLLGCLALASISCGVSDAKPASGFDVSSWSPRLLSISPKISTGKETQAPSVQTTPQPAAGQSTQQVQQSSTDIQ